jgi:dipeptidyl aminopeptidase/acylaminoacyl peptidase
MGVNTMEQAIERLKNFTLAGVAEKITCSLLVLHGADDAVVPLEDAERLFREAGSRDKELRIFRVEDGGSQHCVQDNIPVAGEVIADWLAGRL